MRQVSTNVDINEAINGCKNHLFRTRCLLDTEEPLISSDLIVRTSATFAHIASKKFKKCSTCRFL